MTVPCEDGVSFGLVGRGEAEAFRQLEKGPEIHALSFREENGEPKHVGWTGKTDVGPGVQLPPDDFAFRPVVHSAIMSRWFGRGFSPVRGVVVFGAL